MYLIPNKNSLEVIKEDNVDIKDVKLKLYHTLKNIDEFMISFDGKNYMKFNQEMRIPEKYHSSSTVQFHIKAIAVNGTKTLYHSDSIPVTILKMVGVRIEDMYPNAIRQTLARIDILNEKLEKIEERVKDLELQGEI